MTTPLASSPLSTEDQPGVAVFDDEAEAEDGGFEVKEFDVTASPNDFNIKTIFDFISSGVVRIPGFQRNFVWDIKRSSKLIESILIGLPVPQIFLFEKARNQFLVVDGQQRLMSIYYFIEGRFPKTERRIELRQIFDKHGRIPDDVLHNDKYFDTFNLELPPNLPAEVNKLHGLNYHTLGALKSTFDLRTIRNVIIKQNTPPGDSAIYEIFNRLNSGGINLKPQEIRVSLYHSPFYEMLGQLNLENSWRRLLGQPNPDLHLKDIETLLRGLAMLKNGDNYRPSMALFLNSFSREAEKFAPADTDYYRKLVLEFLAACQDVNPESFQIKRGRFNLTVFEAVFYAKCIEAFKRKDLSIGTRLTNEKLLALQADAVFAKAIRSQTSNTKNVASRLKRAKEILAA